MVRTVVNGCVYTQYRESAKDTSLSSLLDTFADCGDILLRDRSADNGGIKFEGLLAVGIHGLELHFTMTVLSTSTGLLCVLAIPRSTGLVKVSL